MSSEALVPGQQYRYQITVEVDMRSVPDWCTARAITKTGFIIAKEGQTRRHLETELREKAIAEWRLQTDVPRGGRFAIRECTIE